MHDQNGVTPARYATGSKSTTFTPSKTLPVRQFHDIAIESPRSTIAMRITGTGKTSSIPNKSIVLNWFVVLYFSNESAIQRQVHFSQRTSLKKENTKFINGKRWSVALHPKLWSIVAPKA